MLNIIATYPIDRVSEGYLYPPSGGGGKGKGESKGKKDTRFEQFWKAYPKKKSKGQAEKAFSKINPDEQLLATMIAKIEQAKKSKDWIKEGGQYIPYPATWLNAEGWEDEIETSTREPTPPYWQEYKKEPCCKCGKPSIGECDGKSYCTSCWPDIKGKRALIQGHIGKMKSM